MRDGLYLLGLTLLCLGATAPTCADDPTPEQIEFFEKRIRPVLVTQCGECHADGRAKGGFSLASGETALRGGDSGPAIVVGKPEESLLIEVLGHQGDIKMPPKSKLADAEIADLRRWIELGAPWPADTDDSEAGGAAFVITPEQRAFWSFQPLSHAVPSNVVDAAWPAGDVDRFILARLEAAGLQPSPSADRRTLIRRVTFDLIGLPPTPDEIDDFLADERPDAWGQVVDRLLASPHYGERWGRHWLDVARFAEDQAHTFAARNYPNGYRYRDWVVRAFNSDRPYDQFVREQIAGDLLDGPDDERHDRQTAVGYFALGPVYYADAGCAFKASLDELDDRLDTLARGFLGLTIACARCHDHKFDPISQHDYYALAGVFRSTAYREAPLVPPDVVERFDQGQQQIKGQEQSIKTFLDEAATEIAEQTAQQVGKILTTVWQLTHPPAGETEFNPEQFAELARQAGVRQSILERWRDFLVAENRRKLPQLQAWFELVDKAATLPVAADGGAVPAEVAAAAAAFEADVQAALAERDTLQKQFSEATAAASEAQKPNIAKPVLEKPKADLLEALVGKNGLCAIPADKVEGLLDDPAKAQLAEQKKRLEEVKQAAPARYPFVHSLADGPSAAMKLHIRGNPNRTGDEVPRRFLEVLSHGEPTAFTIGSGRLELANAVASPDNPLTVRVIVNRVWQQHFGRGIVATPSNFGALGERPSHPELLDFLAR
ncbi:MAG: DUF1549 domain-containing protein [Planctomycetaceae bacterium]|nr:DUF1549 domain-containing protein [Planctomycetaceae bacterium]